MLFFVELINVVCEWVWIIILYLVLDEVVVFVLKFVVMCGVDVCILILSWCDYYVVFEVLKFYVCDFVDVGVKVFCYWFGFLY